MRKEEIASRILDGVAPKPKKASKTTSAASFSAGDVSAGGTVSTVDRSITPHAALRRHFIFEEAMPDAEALNDVLAATNADEALRELVIMVRTSPTSGCATSVTTNTRSATPTSSAFARAMVCARSLPTASACCFRSTSTASIYRFARMPLEGQAPDARSGEAETFSLLFDMEYVFERHIAAFLASEVMPSFADASLLPQAKGQRRDLYLDGEEKVLRVAPDLVFVHEKSDLTLIIETQWKLLCEEERGRSSRSDLYQLYAYLHRYDCQRAHLLYPKAAGIQTRDLNARGRNDSDAGTVGVRFVDLNKKLWTRDGKTALADELAVIVREGLGLTAAARVGATA